MIRAIMIPFTTGTSGPNTASTSKWLEDAGGVSDPSDWLSGSFSFLRDLDASLRCEICSDILRAPVSIKSCSHTFCSRCIRDYINQPTAPGAPTDRPCPNCRQPKVYDSELVPVPQLEVAAEAWRFARPFLSDKDSDERARREASNEHASSRKRKGSEGIESEGTDLKKRAARTSPQASSGRVTRSRTTIANKGSRSPENEDKQQRNGAIVVDDDSDDDWTEETERRGSPIVQSPTKTNGSKSLKDVSASDVAECPMCGYDFTLIALNRHLDNPNACKGPDGPPPSDRDRGLPTKGNGKSGTPGFGGWLQKGKSSNGTPSTSSNGKGGNLADAVKLKRPQYHLLSEQKMRKLCEEHGLSTSGSRGVLESRHRRWTDLFNANLDASVKYRRSESQLRKEVREWDQGREREEARAKRSNFNGSGSATNGAGSNIAGSKNRQSGVVGASEAERRAYTVSHADHFRELVAQSRKTHDANKQAHATSADESNTEAATTATDEMEQVSTNTTNHDASNANQLNPISSEDVSNAANVGTTSGASLTADAVPTDPASS